MNRELSFFSPVVPPTATAQQKGLMRTKSGKLLFFKKKKVKDAEDLLFWAFFPFKPTSPLDGPVHLSVALTFPWRKSETKANVSKGSMLHCCRPDLDNMMKALIDTLVAGKFLHDDGQVAILHASKHWGTKPGITISIKEL